MKETMQVNNYEKQAEDFLRKTNTEFKAVFLKNDFYFIDDKDKRDIYEITLKKGNREYKFKFGNSLNCSGKYKIFTPKGTRILNELPTKTYYKEFKSSLNKSSYRENEEFKIPTSYDVLSCLQKYEVGTFEDFCSSFGYDEDSRKAEKVYNAVVKEWENIQILYSDREIELLQELE